MYDLSVEDYGRPDWGIQQSQPNSFYTLNYRVGEGTNKIANPYDPYNVDLTWFWSELQMRRFNRAWRKKEELAWGSNWFTIDLPVSIKSEYLPSTSGNIKTIEDITTFNILVGADPTDPSVLGWSSELIEKNGDENLYGEVFPNPPSIAGKEFTQIKTRQDGGAIHFTLPESPDDSGRMELFEPLSAAFYNVLAIDHEPKFVEANFIGGNNPRYSVASPYVADQIANMSIGEEYVILVQTQMPLWRKYRCCPLGPFSSKLVGENRWSVSLSVMIDISPIMDSSAFRSG